MNEPTEPGHRRSSGASIAQHVGERRERRAERDGPHTLRSSVIVRRRSGGEAVGGPIESRSFFLHRNATGTRRLIVLYSFFHVDSGHAFVKSTYLLVYTPGSIRLSTQNHHDINGVFSLRGRYMPFPETWIPVGV